MHKIRFWFFPILLACIAGCQTPMYAGSQCILEPGSMAALQSYAWQNEAWIDVEDGTGFVGPMAVEQLKNRVEQELAGKGFSLVGIDEAPDLELALTLRTRRELVRYDTSSHVCADRGCWERVTVGDGTRMDIRTIGFLAADVYMDDTPVWRGWVETSLYRGDRDNPGEVIGRAIPKLFESFPP